MSPRERILTPGALAPHESRSVLTGCSAPVRGLLLLQPIVVVIAGFRVAPSARIVLGSPLGNDTCPLLRAGFGAARLCGLLPGRGLLIIALGWRTGILPG